MGDMDFLLDDEPNTPQETHGEPWRVMIIDDDESIHQTTKYALYAFTFLGSGIEWIDAYSAHEAKERVLTDSNVALIFLDVVMETDHAGLDFARWFRDMEINPATRIILRTGQPGQAPERKAIVEYDLHDYKTKTELTSEKLFTTTIAALRSYRDLLTIQQAKSGLEKIIDSMQYLFSLQSMKRYATGVLTQINAMIDFRRSGIICAESKEDGALQILAEVGTFKNSREAIKELLEDALETRQTTYHEDYTILTFVDQHDRLFSIYLENKRPLSDIEINLLSVFCSSVSIGFGNIKLLEDLKRSHLATVVSLADLAEQRDEYIAGHVIRISNYVSKIAKKLYEEGYEDDTITADFLEKVGTAAILHDIGKAAVPDSVLLKEGRLDPEERKQIEQHPTVGSHILNRAVEYTGGSKGYLQLAANIALFHHERWDGTGYPKGLKEREIPIEARITAIADVYDALRHKRCYKESFPIEECFHILKKGKGTLFDPFIVDVFLEMIEKEGEETGAEFQLN